MKKNNYKYIFSWIMYFTGIVVLVVSLTLAGRISDEAYLYTLGASIGVLFFVSSGYLRL